eukprot:1144419-Pelagomonas_calceolata.AAC.1
MEQTCKVPHAKPSLPLLLQGSGHQGLGKHKCIAVKHKALLLQASGHEGLGISQKDGYKSKLNAREPSEHRNEKRKAASGWDTSWLKINLKPLNLSIEEERSQVAILVAVFTVEGHKIATVQVLLAWAINAIRRGTLLHLVKQGADTFSSCLDRILSIVKAPRTQSRQGEDRKGRQANAHMVQLLTCFRDELIQACAEVAEKFMSAHVLTALEAVDITTLHKIK